jgi:hypothetical protein
MGQQKMFSVPFTTQVTGILYVLADDAGEAFSKAQNSGLDFSDDPTETPLDPDYHWVKEWNPGPPTFSAADIKEAPPHDDRREHPDYDGAKEAEDDDKSEVGERDVDDDVD